MDDCNDSVSQYVDWFYWLTNVLALFSVGWFLYNAVYLRYTWGQSSALPVGALILCTCIAGAVLREWARRKIEGYHVSSLGGAESGSITYHEEGKTLGLFFDRAEHTVHVPSDDKWIQCAPDWAKSRKPQIMERIKKYVKGWKYVESHNSDLMPY